MAKRLRLIAFVVCLPALVGAWLLVDADDIGVAMAWLLIPAAAAGLVVSLRLWGVRLGDSPRMNAAWKRIFADCALIALGYLVILFASSVATQFVDADGSVFGVGVFIAFLAWGAVLLAVVASFLTLLPLATLLALLLRRSVDAEEALAAALRLALGVFATAIVLATSVDTGQSPRGEAWTAIFVLITGIQSHDARIVSEPLAWIARVALAVLVGCGIALVVRARRRRLAGA